MRAGIRIWGTPNARPSRVPRIYPLARSLRRGLQKVFGKGYTSRNMETSLTIFTDGGCSGNPGPGGWAFVMVQETSQGKKALAEQMGGEKNTTNNRMELRAVIEALRALKSREDAPRKAVVCTDSQYVQKGITSWILKWKQNAWRTSDKKPVKNQDLWLELDSLAGEFALDWKWVRGHSGVEYNELCDRMTQQAIAEAQRAS